MKADLILTNGTIQTMNGKETAQAVAIYKDKIVYVGDDDGAEAFAEEATTIIDLKGDYVIPGFIDGHTHEVMYIIDEDQMLSFEGIPADLEVYKSELKTYIGENPDKDIYYGNGMDLTIFPEGFVTNGWVNEICKDKPVCISDMSHHCFLLNAKAMEMVGLDRNTKVSESANVYKHPNGEPTGFVSDALSLLEALPPLDHSPEKYREAFLKYQNICHSYGVTGIHIAGASIETRQAWKVFNEMEKAGELKLRINCSIMEVVDDSVGEKLGGEYVSLLNDARQYNSDYQRVSQAKALLDGVVEGKSAFLLEPYAPEAGEAPDYRGALYVAPENVKKFAEVINGAGYQIQFHAIGDGAVKCALDAYEHARHVNGDRDYRNMIAHVNLISDEDILRMAELKVIGAMQPLWWYYEPNFSPIEKHVLGKERFHKEFRVRDMLNAGIRITGSIDYPIQADFRPLAGIQVGATQGSPYNGESDDPAFFRNREQTVSVWEMLKAYTVNGAYAMKMDDLFGTIEVGKKADLVVLGKNILNCDVRCIADTKVCCTIMNGDIVYQAE